ncbi:nicotinate-nucleotide--dimethylbenzimidazole phosphoribosyltransferase [Fictibacillus terranigra]|uniref:Nicotinate-nucleotide--dimethylbenzimidazole phosphoribosyltransferase n=1 Tax=Fictibacillus terranigra TaxID=3058424 RepID=A0ABT8ECX9_9BACL|nr:nicotinate-nucleotide--dimethylbenzimidazole phosphoribosyltransferase [Fictibacillus sp. CENA-BCM004]MDN4075791.1 nicotinate-nucleotide--dimethylbenzimidazole phosphoribosyltransferase [Fictibacillus sp. CENA-BCM004]
MKYEWQQLNIPELNEGMGSKAEIYADSLTKPVGSLGRLEALAIELARMTGELFPDITPPGVIVFAADHGIASEGISAYPQEVTSQMVRNFLNGGAAINVFSKSIKAVLRIVDIGVAADLEEEEGLVKKKIRYGTANFYHQDAMSREEVLQAIDTGFVEAKELIHKGVNCLILGEMGIGNTTASSAIIAAVTGQSLTELVGTGTGINNEKVQYKQELIKKSIEKRMPKTEDPIDVLMKLGGLEIAGMAGAMLAAAAHRIPILVDGFISTTAALIATMINSRASDYMIMAHRSAELGHQTLLKLLDKEPLLDLGMRLGEGSGAAVAFPILQSAVLMLKNMATFETAQITKRMKEE